MVKGKVGKMCNVGQHASMISTPLPPLIRFSSSTWHLVLRSFWHSQNVLEIKKMTEQKKPKRIRQKVIQVVVTEAEKKQIEENAAQGNLSASQYLRDLGLGYQPKSLTDIKTIQEIRSLKSDMNKVGGLLKNLMNGELTDPKEIRSKVNGLLLDFSKNQNSIDLFISKVRSAIKF